MKTSLHRLLEFRRGDGRSLYVPQPQVLGLKS